MDEIIRCDQSLVDALSRLAARAFFSDPLHAYLFPDETQRATLLTWDLEHLIQYGMRFGEVYATSSLSGCAVWLPPGETDFTEERMAEAGMLDSTAQIGADAEQRMLRFVTESEDFHRRVAPGLHWYLVLLGVDPARQGEGIGSVLLAPVLARAAEGKLPVYLETANPDNLPFYQKRGFAVRAEAPLSGGVVQIWYLVRDPKP